VLIKPVGYKVWSNNFADNLVKVVMNITDQALYKKTGIIGL